MDIGKIIRDARLKRGHTLKSVEAATGIITSAQSKIELGDIGSPSFFHVAKLAQFYGLSLDGIYDAVLIGRDSPLTAAKAEKCHHVPIISWVQAGAWSESGGVRYDSQVITSPFRCSGRSFALEVKGDSMTSPPGALHSFPEGCHIIVDPEAEAHNKSFVVVNLEGSDEATFKQLILDGNKFLKPLNPQYPVIPVDQPMRVCGVVLGAVIDCS